MIELSRQSTVGSAVYEPREITQEPVATPHSPELMSAGVRQKIPDIPDEHAESIVNGALNTLDTALEIDEMLEQTQELRAAFHHDPLVQQGVQALTDSFQGFLRDGEMRLGHDVSEKSPGGEVFKVMADVIIQMEDDEYHDARDDLPYGASSAPESALSARLSTVFEALNEVAQNQYDNPHARRLSNVANQTLHSFLTSGLPTFVRQAVAYGIEKGIGNNAVGRMLLGGAAGSLSLISGLTGLVRDNVKGTATGLSNFSRGTLLLFSTGVLTAACATGALANVAPTLAAYNLVQRTLSDSIQTCLTLEDGRTRPSNAKEIAINLGVTIANAMLVYSVYYYGASNSGQAAADEGGGWAWHNDLLRGLAATGSSVGGEFLKRFVSDCTSSIETREDLRLSLKLAFPKLDDAIKQFCNSFASATSAANVFPLLEALAPVFKGTGMNEAESAAASNGVAAMIDGLGFLHGLATEPRTENTPRPDDVEVGDTRL